MARETSSTIFKDLVNSPVGIIAEYIVNRLAMKSGYTPLKEFISEIQTGKTPPMNNPEYYSSNDMEWIKPSDIGFEKYITASDWISNIAVKANKATIYKPNTVLIICIGGGIGRLGIVNKPCSSNQQITGVLFKDNVIPEYAYYFFLSRYKIFEANSSKSTLPIINQKGLGNLDFLCPKVDVQKDIVKYLDYCNDCLIGNNYPTNKKFNLESEILSFAIRAFKAYYTQKELLFEYQNQLTQLTNLNQAILQEAVQGKLLSEAELAGLKDEPDYETGQQLLERIKAEKNLANPKIKKILIQTIKKEEIPFEIPENWVWCKMGDVSTSIVPNRDKPKSFTGDIPWITQSNFSDFSFQLDYDLNGIGLSEEEVKEYNCRVMPKGSVIMSCVGQFDLVCLVERNIVANQQLHCFVPFGSIEPMYLCYSLKLFSKLMEKEAIHTTIKYINKTKCESILLPLPPLSEQKRIVAEIEKQLAKTKQLKEHIIANQQATEQLLKALLHGAFEVEEKCQNQDFHD